MDWITSLAQLDAPIMLVAWGYMAAWILEYLLERWGKGKDNDS